MALGEDEPQQNNKMNPKDMKVPLPQRDEVTARQLGCLLQAAATLYPILLNHDPDKESNNGGPLEAAEATFTKICDRIDSIIDDPKRWNLDLQNTLEMQLSELYQSHINLLRTQQAATSLLASPHTIHKPSLLKLEDGSWLAVLGDLNNPEKCIIASGRNPAEAMMAWDMVFTGQMQPQTVELKEEPKQPARQPRKKSSNGK